MTKIIEPSKQSNIFRRPSSETGIWSWITTVDHKRIGIMYGYAAFFFLLIGGLLLFFPTLACLASVGIEIEKMEQTPGQL